MLSISKNLVKSIPSKLNMTPSAYFAKELAFDVECRNKMLAGCDKLADAV
jgi:hypothetical protein